MKEYRLEDAIIINPTESLKKDSLAKKISMDILKPFTREVPSFSYEKYAGGTKFKNGDTIMARITPCLENGKTAFVNILDKDEIGFGSTEYIVFRAKENITDPLYVYYLITSDTIREPAIKSMVGSSGRQRVQTDVVKNLRITIPELETQKKIANILSSLDDKIELNNRINDNLEQQAQAIFKSWFVDFEPFGGEMPAGWRMGKLSEILKLKKNSIQSGEDKSLPYLPIDLIPIKSLAIKESRPNEEALSSLLRFEENDILIGAMRVYFHRVAIAPFDGITRTTCFVLEPQNPNYFAYGVITCNQDLAIDYAQKTSKGSTMPYAVWEGGLGEYEIPIPDNNTAMKFNNIVKPLLEQIKKSYFENRNLQDLRDTLLPKLMSGELDVDKIEL